eukprot:g7950.t1
MADEFLAASSKGVQRKNEAVHTVKASLGHDAYHALCRLRREDQAEGEIIEKALILLDTYSVVSRALGQNTLVKAVNVVQQMRNAGYSDEWATTLCRALFRQKDKDLRKAFRLFDQDGQSGAQTTGLREALPLMGEEVPDARIEELFAIEFCFLVKGLNKEEGEEADAFAAFRTSAEDTLGAVGTGAALSAVSTAWSANLPGLSPFELRKAGVVLKKMTAAGYSEAMADTSGAKVAIGSDHMEGKGGIGRLKM